MPLDPLPGSAKEGVPESRLLAVIGAALPPFAVVQVVVFESKLAANEAERPGGGVGKVSADASVATSFDESVVMRCAG